MSQGVDATPAHANRRPSLRVLLAIGLVSASALGFQVLLTRLLSAVLFYDFVFLAISLALLGTGAGGILVYVRPAWFDRVGLERALARASALLAVLFVLVPVGLVHLDYTYNNTITTSFVIAMVLACVISLLPFVTIGVAIALAIRGYGSSVGRVYAFDLVGAGLGAALVVPLMWVVSAPAGIVIMGIAAALAALLFTWTRALGRWLVLGSLVISVVGTSLALSTGIDFLPSPYFPGTKPAADVWTPLDRVLGFAPKPERASATSSMTACTHPCRCIAPARPSRIGNSSRRAPRASALRWPITATSSSSAVGEGETSMTPCRRASTTST